MKNLSIIIAAYNIEAYIGRCLDSVIKNNNSDLEIVVVNDGSKDNTLKIINEYAKNDNRIIVIDRANGGIIEARKTGYENSTGKYIWFIDGDDYISGDAINILKDHIDNNLYDIVCFNAIKTYDYKEEELFNINNKIGILNNDEYLKNFLLEKLCGALWGKIIKKDFIEKNNIKFPGDISYGDDTSFTLSMAVNKPKVLVLEDYFYFYYQRESSIMNSENEKILELEKLNKFCREQLVEKDLLKSYNEEFQYFLYVHNFKYIVSKIYGSTSKYGNQLFNIWNSLNIDLKNNKYFNMEEQSNLKKFTKIAYKNYFLGKMIFRIKGEN